MGNEKTLLKFPSGQLNFDSLFNYNYSLIIIITICTMAVCLIRFIAPHKRLAILRERDKILVCKTLPSVYLSFSATFSKCKICLGIMRLRVFFFTKVAFFLLLWYDNNISTNLKSLNINRSKSFKHDQKAFYILIVVQRNPFIFIMLN